MEIFLGWIIFAVILGIAASNRGRSGFGWFLIGALLSPLIGFILLFVIPNLIPEQQKALKAEQAAANSKKCPQCAETVKKEAKICRFCQFDFGEELKVNTSEDDTVSVTETSMLTTNPEDKI